MSWVPTPPKAHLWYSKINKVHNRALVIIQSGVNHCTISFDLCLFSDENKNGEMQKKKKTKKRVSNKSFKFSLWYYIVPFLHSGMAHFLLYVGWLYIWFWVFATLTPISLTCFLIAPFILPNLPVWRLNYIVTWALEFMTSSGVSWPALFYN